MSVFRSAIDNGEGQVDAGYLILFWAMIGWSVAGGVILFGACLAGWHATPSEMGALLKDVGIAEGAVSGGFATVVGAVGLFRAGDKEKKS